jgi:hypothetical protein
MAWAKRISGLLLGAALLLPAAAGADDYDRFEVPVRVSGIHPDISRVGVGCAIFDPEDNTVGLGTGWASLTDGAFDGDIVVSVRDLGSHPRWRASRWRCSLKFPDPYAGGRSMLPAEYQTRFGVDASQPLVPSDEGSIAP